MGERIKPPFMQERKPLAEVAVTRPRRSYNELMQEAGEKYRSVDFGPRLRQELLWDGLVLVAALRERQYHTIVFADRGARPLAMLLRQVWRRLYPNESPPVMKFLAGNTQPSSMAAAEQIRQSFGMAAADFNGKRVLIFDEARSTGSTLDNMIEKFQEAYPAAQVSGSTYGDYTAGVRQFANARALDLFSILSLRHHYADVWEERLDPRALDKWPGHSRVRPKYRYLNFFSGAELDATAELNQLSPSNVLSAIGKQEPWGIAEGMQVVNALLEAYDRYEDTRTGVAAEDYCRHYDRADIGNQLRLACRTVLATLVAAPAAERQAEQAAGKRCAEALKELGN